MSLVSNLGTRFKVQLTSTLYWSARWLLSSFCVLRLDFERGEKLTSDSISRDR